MNKKTINGLIVVGGIIVAFIIAKRFLMDKKDAAGGGTGGTTGGGTGGTTGGGTGGSTGGGQAGYENLDYLSMANRLFEAMNGYGTNEDNIYAIMRSLNNQSDWNKLQQAYGVKKLSSGAGNIFVSDFNGNLKNSLVNELSSSELLEVRKILSSKGISF